MSELTGHELMEHIDSLQLSDAAIRFRYGDEVADEYVNWLYMNVK